MGDWLSAEPGPMWTLIVIAVLSFAGFAYFYRDENESDGDE